MNQELNNKNFKDNDKLNRKNQAIKISRILANSENYSRPEEGLVVALNSSWGTGKTMFLKMWENEINETTNAKNINQNTENKNNIVDMDPEKNKLNNSFPLCKEETNTLYYNAWEHDDYDNACIPIVAHLNRVFKKTLVRANLKEETIKEFSSTLKKWGETASKLVFIAGKNIVKKKLGLDKIDIDISELLNFKQSDFNEYLDFDDKIDNLSFEEIEEKLGELSDKTKEKYLKIKSAVEPEIFDDFESFKRIKEDFKDALKNISKDKKLIVFVDELDRCRPLYAIETLEAVKHFFSVPNVIFVLSVDIEQLSHSIATVYGQNMDSVGYLMRFIDLQFRIPEPNISDFCDFLNVNNYFNIKQLEIIEILFSILRLSLREIEKIFRNIKILFDMINPGFKLDNQKFGFYSLLVILKYKYSIYYKNLLMGKYTFDELNKTNESFYLLMKKLTSDKKLNDIYIDGSILDPLLNQSVTMKINEIINSNAAKQKYKCDYFFVKNENNDETVSQYIQRQIEMADFY